MFQEFGFRSHSRFENSKLLYEQKCDKNMYYTFAHVCKISLLLTLLKIFFVNYSRIWMQHEILRFFNTFWDFYENIFKGDISTFCKLWSKTRLQRLKKWKIIFCDVLECNVSTTTEGLDSSFS
jgi:hypothetical protein